MARDYFALCREYTEYESVDKRCSEQYFNDKTFNNLKPGTYLQVSI